MVSTFILNGLFACIALCVVWAANWVIVLDGVPGFFIDGLVVLYSTTLPSEAALLRSEYGVSQKTWDDGWELFRMFCCIKLMEAQSLINHKMYK